MCLPTSTKDRSEENLKNIKLVIGLRILCLISGCGCFLTSLDRLSTRLKAGLSTATTKASNATPSKYVFCNPRIALKHKYLDLYSCFWHKSFPSAQLSGSTVKEENKVNKDKYLSNNYSYLRLPKSTFKTELSWYRIPTLVVFLIH